MFKPKNDKPYWRLIYDFVVNADMDTVFTFDDLSKAIGADIEKQRASVYRATKELLKDVNTMLISERGTGYRLVRGMDIYYHSEGRGKKARRQVRLANFEASNINTIELSVEEKNKLQQFLVHNRRIAEAMTQKADRAQTASQYATIASQHAQAAAAFSAQEIAQLKEMLGTS